MHLLEKAANIIILTYRAVIHCLVPRETRDFCKRMEMKGLTGMKEQWAATVRFPRGKRAALKAVAAQRSMTMEEALLEAFEVWSQGGGRKATPFGKRVASLASTITAQRQQEAVLCILEAFAVAT